MYIDISLYIFFFLFHTHTSFASFTIKRHHMLCMCGATGATPKNSQVLLFKAPIHAILFIVLASSL